MRRMVRGLTARPRSVSVADCSSSTSCANISGATSSSYTLASSDVGETVDVVVTARNAGRVCFGDLSQTSAVQTPPAPVSTAAPAISGGAQQGTR